MQLLEGKSVAAAIREKFIKDIELLASKGIVPKLEAILVGDSEDSLTYVRSIERNLLKYGLKVKINLLPADTTEADLIGEIERCNGDHRIHGILLLQPFPPHINRDTIKYKISPAKDIEGLNPQNLGIVMCGDNVGFEPCTAKAVVEILDHYHIPLKGADVVMIGASMVVGKPLGLLLLNRGATVTFCHVDTVDTRAYTTKADIVISAVGRANLFDMSYLNPDSVVIDVGINMLDGRIVGDFNHGDIRDKIKALTPVPGGVGIVTTSVLIAQLVKAAKLVNNIAL